MSVYVKQISELPIVEEINGSENIIVNDNGETKQLPINKISPQNIKKEQLSDELLNYLATKEDTWPSELPMPSDGGFGYTEQGEQTVIAWDGDTEGRDLLVLHSPYGDVNCYKVAEKETEYPEAASVELTIIGGESTKFDVELNEYTGAYTYNAEGQPVLVIASAGDISVGGFTGNAPSDGVYFVVQSGFYTSSLTYGTPDTVHKIDEKYLPEGGVGYIDYADFYEATDLDFEYDSEAPYFRYYYYFTDFPVDMLFESPYFEVELDEEIYYLELKTIPNGGYYLGEIQNDWGWPSFDNYPFCITLYSDGYADLYSSEKTYHHLKLRASVIHKIDSKYIDAGADPVIENAKSTGGIGWTEQGEQTVVVNNESVTTVSEGGPGFGMFATPFDIVDGAYTVIFNGTEYNLNSTIFVEAGVWGLGELGEAGPDFSRYPFVIASMDGMTAIYTESAGDYEITVKTATNTIHKIDEKYLPSNIAEEIIIKITEVERGIWEIDETTLPTTKIDKKNKDRIYFELNPYNYFTSKCLCKATSFEINGNDLRGAIGLCPTTASGDATIYKAVLDYSSDIREYYAYVEEYSFKQQK